MKNRKAKELPLSKSDENIDNGERSISEVTIDRETLIEEYSRCDEKAGRIDSLVWQMASILFPITLAGIAYFGSLEKHSVDQFFIILILAFGSMSLIITWCLLALQWHGYQSIAYYRMREIEEELGLWHFRYSGYMSWSEKKRAATLKETKLDVDKQKYIKMAKNIRTFPRVGLKGAVIGITALFGLGWILMVVRELLLIY